MWAHNNVRAGDGRADDHKPFHTGYRFQETAAGRYLRRLSATCGVNRTRGLVIIRQGVQGDVEICASKKVQISIMKSGSETGVRGAGGRRLMP